MIPEEIVTLLLPYPGREDRKVRVFIPAHEEGEKLPVIYMTDGQNLFDVESSGFGCWYTREAVRDEREKSAISLGVSRIFTAKRFHSPKANIFEIPFRKERFFW